MKEIYEIGIIFRGFTLIFQEFRKLPVQDATKKDLRGAFISAISSFAESAFNNNSLEYLESGNFLFIFKMDKVISSDSLIDESIIMYGLTEKKKKNPDKFVKKFIQKIEPILEHFIVKHNNKDFTDLSLFEAFQNEIKEYFIN